MPSITNNITHWKGNMRLDNQATKTELAIFLELINAQVQARVTYQYNLLGWISNASSCEYSWQNIMRGLSNETKKASSILLLFVPFLLVRCHCTFSKVTNFPSQNVQEIPKSDPEFCRSLWKGSQYHEYNPVCMHIKIDADTQQTTLPLVKIKAGELRSERCYDHKKPFQEQSLISQSLIKSLTTLLSSCLLILAFSFFYLDKTSATQTERSLRSVITLVPRKRTRPQSFPHVYKHSLCCGTCVILWWLDNAIGYGSKFDECTS